MSLGDCISSKDLPGIVLLLRFARDAKAVKPNERQASPSPLLTARPEALSRFVGLELGFIWDTSPGCQHIHSYAANVAPDESVLLAINTHHAFVEVG